ncbi:unnamed protein product [Closterium sp. NIES-65]|nr:unnamed protein product [Closterium sp. NIES-65]
MATPSVLTFDTEGRAVDFEGCSPPSPLLPSVAPAAAAGTSLASSRSALRLSPSEVPHRQGQGGKGAGGPVGAVEVVVEAVEGGVGWWWEWWRGWRCRVAAVEAEEAAVVAEGAEAAAVAEAAEVAEATEVAVCASSSSAVLRTLYLSSFVSGTLGVSGGWGSYLDLDYDAILAAMHAVSTDDEGDCYLCVPPDPGIEAAALGAGETAAPGASASAAPGAGESALSAPSGTLSGLYLPCSLRTCLPLSLPPLPQGRPLPASPASRGGSAPLLTPLRVSSDIGSLQPLHMDVWGPARVRGQGHERYFFCWWLKTTRYAAHQLNLQPRVSLPETSPTLRWTGKVGDASAFRVWGSRAFVRDLYADKLSPRAVPYDVTFDESVPYYRLFPCRTAPLPPPLLFLAPGPPPVDPLPPQGPAPSGVSQPRGAEPGGAEPGGADLGVRSVGVLSLGVRSLGVLGLLVRAAGAGGTTVAAGPVGARPGGSGAAGTGSPAGGATGATGAAGGTSADGPTGVGLLAGAAGAGAAWGVSAVFAGAGASEGAGVGVVGAGGAAGAGATAGGTGAVPTGSRGAARPGRTSSAP